MRVLVAGSGTLAKMLVSETSRRGHDTAATASNVSGMNLGTELAGCHAVICAFETNVLPLGTEVLRAMRRHNVRRLLCLTAAGAGDTRGRAGFFQDRVIQPVFERRRFYELDQWETLVRASDRDWSIIRPARMTDAPADERFSVVTKSGGLRADRLSRRSVARWTAKQLESDQYLYKAVVLTR